MSSIVSLDLARDELNLTRLRAFYEVVDPSRIPQVRDIYYKNADIWPILKERYPDVVEWCQTISDNPRETKRRSDAFHMRLLRAFYTAVNPERLPTIERLYSERGPDIWDALDKRYPGRVHFYIGQALLRKFRHDQSSWEKSKRNTWITALLGAPASGGRRRSSRR